MTRTKDCPCGSGQPFADCCAPYLCGAKIAATAEALMRSRYTAYVEHDDAYLIASWDQQTCPDDLHPSASDGSTWTGLKILRTEAGGENDNEGVVEFVASCDVRGTPAQLHEISQFRRSDGRWLYVDGDTQQPVRRSQPKVGRNEPCFCGSGKKYKRCCGG
ncbi:MAG TPA: hypothetical protein ENI94_00780 [Gammaproteobacteria bacterium]|nr:hypothetical protein [Gammaproteobacteria bacterium]